MNTAEITSQQSAAGDGRGRQTARRFFKVSAPQKVWLYFQVGCTALFAAPEP